MESEGRDHSKAPPLATDDKPQKEKIMARSAYAEQVDMSDEHVLEFAGDLAGTGVSAPADYVAGHEVERTLYRSLAGDFYFHSRLDGLDLMEPTNLECARQFLIATKTPIWIAEAGLGCALAEISPPADTDIEPLEATP